LALSAAIHDHLGCDTFCTLNREDEIRIALIIVLTAGMFAAPALAQSKKDTGACKPETMEACVKRQMGCVMPSQASPFNVATPSGGVTSGRSVADCITRRSLAVQTSFCVRKLLREDTVPVRRKAGRASEIFPCQQHRLPIGGIPLPGRALLRGSLGHPTCSSLPSPRSINASVS
jgi:hypothetical protein